MKTPMASKIHPAQSVHTLLLGLTLPVLAAAILAFSTLSLAHASKEKHKHHAETHTPAAMIGDLHLENVWARATPPGAKNGAAYLVIHNTGASGDSLIGGSAPAIAERVEIHTHIDDNGVMRMRQVEEIRVDADAVSKLVPGGDHVMLIGLKKQLNEGETISLSLIFKNTGKIELMVPVSRTAPAGSDHHNHGEHDHGRGNVGHGTGHGEAHGEDSTHKKSE